MDDHIKPTYEELLAEVEEWKAAHDLVARESRRRGDRIDELEAQLAGAAAPSEYAAEYTVDSGEIPGQKRWYPDVTHEVKCPNCGDVREWPSSDYLSYPHWGKGSSTMWCHGCDYEWQVPFKLELKVSVGAPTAEDEEA